jgi:hypothetical protein
VNYIAASDYQESFFRCQGVFEPKAIRYLIFSEKDPRGSSSNSNFQKTSHKGFKRFFFFVRTFHVGFLSLLADLMTLLPLLVNLHALVRRNAQLALEIRVLRLEAVYFPLEDKYQLVPGVLRTKTTRARVEVCSSSYLCEMFTLPRQKR